MRGDDSIALAFPYGRDTVTVEVPGRYLLPFPELRCEPALRDPARAVRRALANPFGTGRLRDLARGWPDCAVAVPDHTRWAPVSIMLPPLLDELHNGGLSAEQITILVALGTHRAMSEEELRRHLGADICDRYRVLNHDWRDESNLVRLGTTRQGTPVAVNRLYYESALKVALGAVKPHGVVGWSGGAKILQPGLGDVEGAGATHWRSAQVMGSEIG
jgi:nickel-dependent lactate racemase